MFRLGKFAWNRRAILVATIPALLALVGLLTVAVDEVYGQAVPGGMDAPTLNPGSASIFVTWVAPSENGGSAITGYEMYYKATDGGSIIEGYDGATTLSDSFGATDSSVGSYGTVYEVKVRAKNAQGYGPWSDTSTEKFGSKINFPRKYVVREITENSSGNVGAAVTPNRGGSGTSTVYVLSGSGSNLFNIGSGNGQISIKGSTKIDFESLKPQNNRPVRPGSRGWNLTITATKEFSTNGKYPKRYEASTVVIVVVLDQDGEPDSPSNLTAIPHDAQVTLSWDNAGDDTITEYQYRRSSDGGTTWAPDWEVIPDSDKDTTSFEITELANGTEYTFSVRAINDVGAGASSPSVLD